MALTGLHTDWEEGSYLNDRNYFLGHEENQTGPYTRPYYDGSIAIGYEFDLIEHIDPAGSEITAYLNSVNDALGLEGTQRVTLSQHDITLLIEARTATGERRRQIYRQLNLRFPSENYAATLFGIMLPEYESALDAALGGPAQLLQSKERIAIISLLYTMTNPTSASITNKIPATISAIQHDNRAEAWYEIRYNSNARNRNTARRYREANLFGLYDSGTLTADQETAQDKEIMRMYTIHELQETRPSMKMSAYEGAHSQKPAKTIVQEIAPAKNYLVNNFALGNTIDGEVMVGKGLVTYDYPLYDNGNYNDGNLTGKDQNDLIFGEKGNDKLNGAGGNDVIYGGEGNDILIGGIGNDTLMGGENDDTYIINAGDGNDTIEDKQGKNKIVFCGEEIKFFYKNGSTYTTFNGALTAFLIGVRS